VTYATFPVRQYSNAALSDWGLNNLNNRLMSGCNESNCHSKPLPPAMIDAGASAGSGVINLAHPTPPFTIQTSPE
jgi:hypothetical protein